MKTTKIKDFFSWLSESHREEKVMAKTYAGEPIYKPEYDAMFSAAYEEGKNIKKNIDAERKNIISSIHDDDELQKVLLRKEKQWNDQLYVSIKQTLGNYTPGGINNVSDKLATDIYDEVMKVNESSLGVSGECEFCKEEGLLPYSFADKFFCCQTCMENGKEKISKDE